MRIAIDGPAGAGKSTVAKEVARRLGYAYIDTGAMYRAVALAALRAGIPAWDVEALSNLSGSVEIRLGSGEDGSTRVYLDGQDVSREIRAPEVSRFVSRVAEVPGVRRHLTEKQRRLAASGRVVMEGRDIGTVVLPDAERKFFITATVEERARRRYAEAAGEGYSISYEEQINEIMRRDSRDASRGVAPLIQAPDAVVIDTTGKSPGQVAETILSLVRGG
ncbi:MAG TPA: (d)CMP kinase [Desulfotomaculum sp.]|nr:(d)CMP kinase [Desulfotomaculum sp.]